MSRFRAASAAIALMSVFFTVSAARAQRTIHVPTDETTIQAGIDMANNGDTVLIAPGTYFENIDFMGKAITVTSSDGAAKTIIDGGGNGTAVTFKSGEPRAAVLSNLTITHGGTAGQFLLDYRSGVVITNSSPTLLNNIITQNYCQNVYVNQAAPLIQGNVISASLNPEKCVVLQTGGIYLGNPLNPSYHEDSLKNSAQVIGNTIENNTTGQLGDGGGDGGPGISIWGGSPLIEGNIIRNNLTRTGSGGGINVTGGYAVSIVQNVIYGNSAGCGGGAIGSGDGTVSGDIYLLIANNTIVGDVGGGNGGYSDCQKASEIWTTNSGGGPTIKFVNNIFAANIAPAIGCGLYDTITDQAHLSTFDHNLFYDTDGQFFGPHCLDVSGLNGNLSADPQFVDLSGLDFHLKSTSPAIDAGNGSVLAMLSSLNGVDLTKDFDGNVREQDATGKGRPIIDMGAYEFSGEVDATPTRVVLSSSAFTGPAGSNFTLTATLSSALGVPGGSADFFMDGQKIGSADIVSGVSTLSNVLVKPGVHVLYASYAGAGSFQPAISVIIVLDIDLYTTSLTMNSSPNPSLVGQAVQFSVHTASADSTYIPTPIQVVDSFSNATLATLRPDASGNASFSISTLALGDHSIYASYAGDTLHASASISVFQQVVNGYATNTTLSSTPNPSNHNQVATFTAQVTSGNGTPTGAIRFTDGASTVLGIVTLDQNGNASLPISTLAIGQHTIAATYVASGAFAGSSASVVQQVNGLATTAVLTANPATIQFGATVTLTATAAAATGTGVPTGSVSFYDDGTLLGTVTLGASGGASLPVSTLHAGVNGLTCSYAGDSVYSPSQCAMVSYTVQAIDTALTLNASAEPTPALTPVTFTARLTSQGQPNAGAVQFYVDGNLIAGGMAGGGGTTTIQVPLQVGNHTVAAKFAGNAGLNASSATVTEIATQNQTAISLGTPPVQVYQNESFSIGFSVQALTGSAQPYGAVTLVDGGTVIASQSLLAAPSNATTSFAVEPLTVGVHTLVAVYTPTDGNFAASRSGKVAVTVSPQTFTFTLEAPSMTIQTEYHKSMGLTLTSVGGWTGPVRLGCGSLLPDYLTCELTPGVTLAADGTVATTLTLDTDALLNFRGSLEGTGESPRGGSGPTIGLAGLFLPLVCFGWRRRLRGQLLMLALAFAGLGAMTGLSGCSGRYPAHTPPGSYNVTLTATGTSAGATVPTTQTVVLTLLVTP